MAQCLHQWLHEVGVRVSKLAVRGSPGSFGLFAARRCERGERIACVPRSAVFSAEAVAGMDSSPTHSGDSATINVARHSLNILQQNMITQKILQILPNANTKFELMRLALLLHIERTSQSSPWAPYIESLPPSTPNALFLDRNSIAQQFASCGGEREEFCALIEQDQRFFNTYAQSLWQDLENDLSDNNLVQGDFIGSLRWAYSTIQSRAHMISEWDVAGPVPLIDMANHGGGTANAALDVPEFPLTAAQRKERMAWHMEAGAAEEESSQSMIMLVATMPIEPNQEVLIDYGCSNNEASLRSYGFTYPSYPNTKEAESPGEAKPRILSSPYTRAH